MFYPPWENRVDAVLVVVVAPAGPKLLILLPPPCEHCSWRSENCTWPMRNLATSNFPLKASLDRFPLVPSFDSALFPVLLAAARDRKDCYNTQQWCVLGDWTWCISVGWQWLTTSDRILCLGLPRKAKGRSFCVTRNRRRARSNGFHCVDK